MTESKFIFMLLAIIAGIAVTIQGPVNAALGAKVKNADFATLWSFVGGSAVLLIYFFAIKKYSLPSIETLKTVPWWAYLGAITGIIYVFSVVLVIPQLGVGRATVLLLLAQIITAMLLDHFGALGLAKNPITMNKIVGLVFMVVGIVFINI